MATISKSLFSAFLLCLLCFISSNTMAQGFAPKNGFQQLNFGLEFEGYGIPVYAGMDFGVGSFITIGPRILFETNGSKHYTFNKNGQRIGLNYRSTAFIPGFRGDYHFSGHIDGMTNKLDLYGGLTLGVGFYKTKREELGPDGEIKTYPNSYSDTELWGQLGARYYFNQNWAAQLEFNTLAGGDGALGVSYRF